MAVLECEQVPDIYIDADGMLHIGDNVRGQFTGPGTVDQVFRALLFRINRLLAAQAKFVCRDLDLARELNTVEPGP